MSIQFQDNALNGLAQLFFLDKEAPTFGVDLLDLASLDFSVNSLQTVDRYLLKIRKDRNHKKDLPRIILRCGAYVGEVIRLALPEGTYHWVDYKTAEQLDPIVKDFGYSANTAAILYKPPQGLTFPLAKVSKCLQNGESDNTHFFAQAIIAMAQQEKSK